MKRKAIRFLITFLFGYSGVGLAQFYPKGLFFIGLSGDKWSIYFEYFGSLAVLKSAIEPRGASLSIDRQVCSYISPDSSLHEVNLSNNVDNIAKSIERNHAYAQPVYDRDNLRLFVVSLKEGASVDTDILVRENGQWKVAVNQRSAQFEPYFQPPNTLYYSNVHCTEDCGRIIQEIWRKDLTSGIAGQVTLTNSIARQPVVSKDGETLYFSSNKAGYYHIWQLSLASNTYRQLTSGAVTDESPALDSEGHLYFIRHSADGRGAIMQWQDGDEPIELPLPEGVTDVRDLDIRQ